MQLYKQKIAAAKKGHELLKRKADALKKKFKEVMKDLLDSKKKMGEECKEAFFLMAEAKYAAGEFTYPPTHAEAKSQRQSSGPPSDSTSPKRTSPVFSSPTSTSRSSRTQRTQ
jgi:hypothetical protein